MFLFSFKKNSVQKIYVWITKLVIGNGETYICVYMPLF